MKTWRGKPLYEAPTAELREAVQDHLLRAEDFWTVHAELRRREEIGERWFQRIKDRLDSKQIAALVYIRDEGGRVMPSTEEMASVLASLGGVM